MFKKYLTNGVTTAVSYVLRTTPEEKLVADLTRAGVPVSLDPCRTCANPCDVGHSEYPKFFMVDNLTNMLGTVEPYMRQVIISTGKADWVREVTDEDGSLASFIYQESHSSEAHAQDTVSSYPPSKPTSKISVLNGSHTNHGNADDHTLHRILVFPDYKVITHVPNTRGGAGDVFNEWLSPSVGRTGGGTARREMASYVLPYACVILLCRSHKRRDNRCHVSAPKLETSFCDALEAEGWMVDHDLRDEDCMGHSLETGSTDIQSMDQREKFMQEKLQEASEGSLTGQKLALIVKVSHFGGHKYAGNAIIYTPQGTGTGTGVWYGRVSPHEVPSVVKHTILEGKILPGLLRGGININRESGKSLLDW